MSVRWAVAGFGWVARDYMMPGIEAAGGRVVAVADPSPSAQAKAASVGIATFDDVATMLGQTEVEALYVATPNNLHLPAVHAAAAAGVPVLCEKPMEPPSTSAITLRIVRSPNMSWQVRSGA